MEENDNQLNDNDPEGSVPATTKIDVFQNYTPASTEQYIHEHAGGELGYNKTTGLKPEAAQKMEENDNQLNDNDPKGSVPATTKIEADDGIAKPEVAKKMEQNDIATGEEASNRKSLTVHVYGGSITAGSYLENRFSSLLQSMMQEHDHNMNVVVSNFGISASGPEYWNQCGIGSADIIISEFRINEQSPEKLKAWYELAQSHSKHLVVLDLWSWLTPPNKSLRLTVNVLPTRVSTSLVSLDKIEQDTWRDLVPSYFNYTGYSAAAQIPEECYDSRYGRSENETRQMRICAEKYANSMQHGTEVYHEQVAKRLYNHLVPTVVTSILKDDGDHIDRTSSDDRTTLCIGKWGLIHHGNRGKIGSWDMTIVHNEGFSVNYPYEPFCKDAFKITLNTNSTSSQLQLNCPPHYNTAKVGYMAHSDEKESGIIVINGAQVSTRLKGENRPHIRIRQYSSSLTLPINVSIEELPTGQYIEFTGLVCSKI